MAIRGMASAYNAYRNLSVNQLYSRQTANRLSSGYRINSAADNAAGLAISEKMRGQIKGLDKASENTQNAVSLIQTADGTLDSAQSIIGRMRELAVQSADGTYTDDQLGILNKEFSQLKGELDRISSSANFNEIRLLNGSMGGVTGEQGIRDMGISSISTDGDFSGSARFTVFRENSMTKITAELDGKSVTREIARDDARADFDFGEGRSVYLEFNNPTALREGIISNVGLMPGDRRADMSKAVSVGDRNGLTFQIGAYGNFDQRVALSVGNTSSYGLNVHKLDIGSSSKAGDAVDSLDKASRSISGQRANLGSLQNRMEHTVKNLGVSRESTSSSESRIRDSDMAREVMDSTSRQIMEQTSSAMIAQSLNLARSNMLMLLTR